MRFAREAYQPFFPVRSSNLRFFSWPSNPPNSCNAAGVLFLQFHSIRASRHPCSFAVCSCSAALAYSGPTISKGRPMKREVHRWHSPRLGMELGVVVYGHWGSPLIGFPTSAGDEWELENQGMIASLSDFIEGGRIKIYSVNSINGLSFYNKGAHPFHRSYVQKVFDAYLRDEVVPFIHDNCQSSGIAISTMGASFGAYHAANSLFKHPDVIKRCFAMSGVYDLKNFMDGMYDDNFYFNNPVDYLSNLGDPLQLEQLATCDIHISTGTGQWENSAPSYRLSEILSRKNIRHSLDNWGPQGGHDWPYWKHQMREYVSQLF